MFCVSSTVLGILYIFFPVFIYEEDLPLSPAEAVRSMLLSTLVSNLPGTRTANHLALKQKPRSCPPLLLSNSWILSPALVTSCRNPSSHWRSKVPKMVSLVTSSWLLPYLPPSQENLACQIILLSHSLASLEQGWIIFKC